MDEESRLNEEIDIQPIDALVRAYGLYWVRDAVDWNEKAFWGLRMKSKRFNMVVNEKKVDAWDQQGVYALYSSGKLMYVGMATGTKGFGERIYSHHTKPRLSGRWDSFSWFAFNGFDEKGQKRTQPQSIKTNLPTVIRTLELAVILAADPTMNRATGKFSGAERINQHPDFMVPQYTNAEIMEFLRENLTGDRPKNSRRK